jgi:hypothetical protein
MAAPEPWFPAKRYGWGWGPPRTRQGRLVLAGFVLLLGLGAVVLVPLQQPAVFVAYALILCAGLIAVCYVKGERPSWRWGK